MASPPISRPALILLPGLDGSGRLFAPLLEALGEDFEAHVISFPGDRAMDYAQLAGLVRPQLPIARPYVILAESFSGPLAIRLAAGRLPGLCGLVLCCTFARSPRPRLGALARPLLGILPLRDVPLTLACRMLAGRDANERWRAQLRDALAPLSSATLRARIEALLDVDVRQEAGAVDVPVLVLRATRDRVVPSAATRELARSLARAAQVDLDAPHFLLQVACHAAAAEIRRFLENPGTFAPRLPT